MLIDRDADTATAAAALGLSGSMTLAHVLTEWGNVVIMLINLLLGIGGLVLLHYRIRRLRRDRNR